MGLFAKRYFYHLFYIAKIQYCTRLVMAKIKTLRYDYKEENEHFEVVPIGKQMKNILQNSSWDVNWKLVTAQRLFLVFSHCYLHIAICTSWKLILYCNCICLLVLSHPFGSCPYGLISWCIFLQDQRKACHRGFDFVKFSDEILAEYASQKVHWIGTRCVNRCYHDIWHASCWNWDMLGPNRHSCGWLSIKGKSLQISLLSQRNSRILGEVKTEGSLMNYLDV